MSYAVGLAAFYKRGDIFQRVLGICARRDFRRLLPEVEMIVVAGIEPVIERVSEIIALESFADTVSRKLHSVEHSARLAELLSLLSERLEPPKSLFIVDIVVIMIGQGYCSVAYARRIGEDIFDCHLGLRAARKRGVYMQIVAGELIEVEARGVNIHISPPRRSEPRTLPELRSAPHPESLREGSYPLRWSWAPLLRRSRARRCSESR